MNGIYLICQNCQSECKEDSSKWVEKTVRKITTKSCKEYQPITKAWLLAQAIEQERIAEEIANEQKEKNKIEFREKILDLQNRV
jgi:antirestriction protein